MNANLAAGRRSFGAIVEDICVSYISLGTQ